MHGTCMGLAGARVVLTSPISTGANRRQPGALCPELQPRHPTRCKVRAAPSCERTLALFAHAKRPLWPATMTTEALRTVRSTLRSVHTGFAFTPCRSTAPSHTWCRPAVYCHSSRHFPMRRLQGLFWQRGTALSCQCARACTTVPEKAASTLQAVTVSSTVSGRTAGSETRRPRANSSTSLMASFSRCRPLSTAKLRKLSILPALHWLHLPPALCWTANTGRAFPCDAAGLTIRDGRRTASSTGRSCKHVCCC